MDQHDWDDLTAALMTRMHWAWPDLCATPLSVVEAVLDRLSAKTPRGPEYEVGK